MSTHPPHSEPGTADSPIGDALLWLGGGQANDRAEPVERTTYQVTGLVVLANALLAWVVATMAVANATAWPVLTLPPFTVIFGLLMGALARTLASGRQVRWSGLVGRAAVALFIGAVLGELAFIGITAGPIDRILDDRAAAQVAAAPAVAQSAQTLDRLRAQRAILDESVRDARAQRDEALVVARCEFNPSPACPPEKITGVPGAGPETRTANELLADAQHELDTALATHDREARALDADIAQATDGLTAAQAAAPSDLNRGLGARWTAMHDYTVGHTGALILRLATTAFFAVLSLLPLVLKLWRGETEQDRRDVARAERERAEREADTAIAVKRAQVRAAAEALWAEQQLAATRLAAEAETAIARERQRRRVVAAHGGELTAPSQALRSSGDLTEPTPLAELTAAALTAPSATDEPPAGPETDDTDTDIDTGNLPVPVDSAPVEQRRSGPLGMLPAALPLGNPIPDITRAVTGIIRPFVPPILARAVGHTRRTLVEEFEEVNVSYTRRRTVTVDEQQSTSTPVGDQTEAGVEQSLPTRVTATRIAEPPHSGSRPEWLPDSLEPAPDLDDSHTLTAAVRHVPTAPKGPRELPPGE
ncbi:DUF4407 domain-containing protein [Rhodococcus sp. JS3073]|uniref:DUF4407 domain-containing protein n=1 Tax=Rhodococcus sp. JS3073 TaxID=3002901 RepID=UPI0022856535|nr:DUF4407 domain-containing protein [Rhodococcus sp. JS3073]WAM19432.1 DUF4407 domain-containing protein [Rhodococcus sp. JS3073]